MEFCPKGFWKVVEFIKYRNIHEILDKHSEMSLVKCLCFKYSQGNLQRAEVSSKRNQKEIQAPRGMAYVSYYMPTFCLCKILHRSQCAHMHMYLATTEIRLARDTTSYLSDLTLAWIGFTTATSGRTSACHRPVVGQGAGDMLKALTGPGKSWQPASLLAPPLLLANLIYGHYYAVRIS